VGPIDLRFATELPEVTADLAQLYRHLAIDRHAPRRDTTPITIVATREPHRLGNLIATPLRRYAIAADGTPMFDQLDRRSLVPYLDWAVNWRIIDTIDRWLLLHAGSVCRPRPDGTARGLLLAAASGSGKSTLTAALVAAGWSLMSDEFGAIDPATQRLEPIPKPMCLKAGSFPPVEAMGLPIRTGRHYIKAFKGRVGYVTPADLADAGHAAPFATAPAAIDAIVFPQRIAGHPLTVEPIAPADAAFRLARHAFNRHKHPAGAMPLLLDLCNRTPCLKLTYAEASDAADRLGDRLATPRADDRLAAPRTDGRLAA
jgi:HprK-related kinase A